MSKCSEKTKNKIRETLKKRGIPIHLIKANTGAIWSEERKKQWSDTAKKFGFGKWMKGKKLSIETRRKQSKSLKGFNKGSKHYNWKDGITKKNANIRNSIEYKLWREAVFARDNWTCQKCKIKGGVLRGHHKENFSQCIGLRTSIENGITFCRNCHSDFHKKYGIKNNTKEQTLEFIIEHTG